MTKALFFDIDGTLVSFNTHAISESAIEAIRQVKAKGIKVFISTGRPFSLINNLNAIKEWIDGYITTNGAYSFIGNEFVACNPMPREEVEAVVKFADELDFPCMIVGEKDLTFYRSNEQVDRVFKQLLNVQDLNENVPLEPILAQRILQLTPVITEETEKELMQKLPGCVSSRWCPDFADITAKGIDKSVGLEALAAHLGIDISETMAFGDGGNDIAIVKRAGIGVAMDNANDSLKAVADYITTSVDEDGVWNALKHFGVL